MADTSDVDAALVAKLLADPTLAGLLPDGVYFDLAKPSAERFILVRHQAHQDIPAFGQGSVYERIEYEVTAWVTSTSGADVKTAAARIHTLLEDGALAPTGYRLMTMHRIGRERTTDYDPDADRRWQFRGGVYLVEVQPT